MADTTLFTGGTYRFQATVYENDGDVAPYNLSGATVTLRLRKPDGTTVSRSATVVDAAGGVARYDCLTADLDVPGPWRRSWRVVNGPLDLTTRPVAFYVDESP